jgi:hypothetical protein
MSITWRELISRFLLVGVSTLITLAVLEGAFRLYFAYAHIDISYYRPSFYYFAVTNKDRLRFSSHPVLPYAPRPFDTRTMYFPRPDIGQTVRLDYTNNSLGFRTPERSFKKPPMTKRVITLGGSTTFDGPTDEQTWSALLEKKLNERYAGKGYKIEAVNLGVDMASSPYSLIDLAFLGVEYEPDLVISYDGVNDSWPIGNNRISPDYRTLMGKHDERQQTFQSTLPQWAFRSYLLSWASFTLDRTTGRRPDLMGQVFPQEKLSRLYPSANKTEGIEYFERNLRLMRAISGEYKARFLAATARWVHPEDKIVSINDELRRFFEAERIDFLDLDRGTAPRRWSIHVDPVHWSLKEKR